MLSHCTEKKQFAFFCASHGCSNPGLKHFECDTCQKNHENCLKEVKYKQLDSKLIYVNKHSQQQQKRVVGSLKKVSSLFNKFINNVQKLDMGKYGLLYNYEQYNQKNIKNRTGDDFCKLLSQPNQIVKNKTFGKGITLQIEQMIEILKDFGHNTQELLQVERILSNLDVKYTNFNNLLGYIQEQNQKFAYIKQFLDQNISEFNQLLKKRSLICFIKTKEVIPQYDQINILHQKILDHLWQLIAYLHEKERFNQFQEYSTLYKSYFSGKFGVFQQLMTQQKQQCFTKFYLKIALKRGDNQKSIKILQSLENLTKQEIQILFELYSKQGNNIKLLELKQRILSLRGIKPQIFLKYSKLAQQNNELAEALKLLLIYEDISKDKTYQAKITKLLLQIGKHQQALKRIQSHDIQDANIWEQKAIIAQNKQQYNNAMQLYTHASKLAQKQQRDNQLVERCNNKIIQLTNFIEMQEKEKEIKKQKARIQNEELNNMNNLTSYTFSQYNFKQTINSKDIVKAKKLFQQLVTLYPNSQYYYLMSKLLYEKAKHTDVEIFIQIQKYLTTAINLRRDYIEAIQLRGQCKLFLKRYSSALQDFNYVLKRKQQQSIRNHQSHFWIGLCYQRLAKIEQAQKQYKQQLLINSKHYASIFNLCKILFKKRQFQQLSKWLQILIDENTNYKVQSLQMMGNIQEEKSNLEKSFEKRFDYWEKAEKWYLEAYNLDKNNNTIKGVNRIQAKLNEYR